MRLGPHNRIQKVAQGPYQGLLSGGRHVWAVVYSAASDQVSLDGLDGSKRVTLPAGFTPLAGFGDLIVGIVETPGGSDGRPLSTIRLLNPVTRAGQADLGPARSVAVGSGLVVWIGGGCARCAVHTYDLTTKSTFLTPGRISSDSHLESGVVSPDRRTLAFEWARPGPAPYEVQHSGDLKDIAVLRLDTGAMLAVPRIVLWPKSSAGLTFSRDSRWLAIMLSEGSRLRLLVWRPGLPAPLASSAHLDGKVAYGPVIGVAA